MTLGQDIIAVGNLDWIKEMEINVDYFRKKIQDLMDRGCNVVFIAKNKMVQGMIGITNTFRPETEATLQALRKDGVTQLCLIIGGTEPIARILAEDLKFDAYEPLFYPRRRPICEGITAGGSEDRRCG